MPQSTTLFDDFYSIYDKIVNLRRGLPIAIAKELVPMQKIQIYQKVQIRIRELSEQCDNIYAAMYKVPEEYDNDYGEIYG